MKTCSVGIVLLCLAPFAHLPAWAQAPGKDDYLALAAKIDRHIGEAWAKAKVAPAAPADDAEFLRRVSLDLGGQIPSVAEARAFLDDTSADKRRRLVERLLASPRYVAHFTGYWRALLLPEANTSLQARYLAPSFEAWVRKELTLNAGYDKMVRELLTTPIDPQNLYRRNGTQAESNPIAFYIAKELKPEELAGGVSRLFLGVRLECAQCHDHPFGDWKRDQFWSFTVFFAGIKGQNQGGDFSTPAKETLNQRSLKVPGTERVVQASYLDGAKPQWKDNLSPRNTMANWVTTPANPYFARAVVNRLWSYFYGAGLVEPVDEMIGANASASHPALLDDLAADFAEHGFDLKYLIQAFTASRAYQLTSAGKSASSEDVRLFERMPVRGLSPEQLFDSIVQATGHREPATSPRNVFTGNNNSVRGEFLNLFTNQSTRPADVQTSIPQALLLLNGKLIGGATNLEQSETLAAIVDAPFLDTEQRIETLFLATLSRRPRPAELARFTALVQRSRPEDSKNALADVFWVLLNSAEFMLNH